MNNINIIKKLCGKINKFKIYKNATMYEGNNNKWILKKNTNNISDLYNYLLSRGFNYLPEIYFINNDIYIYKYVENTHTPNEQRASDLIKLDALLHNKTVYYKDISIDELKELYEKIDINIIDTYNYYNNLLNNIESKIYMSPSEYMLARNSSMIFSCINFCKTNLDEWYEMMKKYKKERLVILHNNLDINHIIRNNENIFISWNKSKRDIPIYDFLKFYKNNYNKFDFNELYNEYIKKFPLNNEERKLLFILLFLPEQIVFNSNELLNTKKVSELCNYLVITDNLFMKNETKNTKKQYDEINEEKKNMKSSA